MSVLLEHVWKSFPRWRAGERSVQSVVSRQVSVLRRRGEQRWALQDVSVDIQPGESIGIIGPNGAGKSTLLRLASGLGRPTMGTVSPPRGASAILALGDLFDLDLTGRENAITAAIVMGFDRLEGYERLAQILDFAELQGFEDAPVRTYSEGMKLRLAFGVAAQLRPSLLLVDEVLAVGDLRFQEKCLSWVREIRDAGTSVIFASHDLDLVASVSDRALWLEAGAVRAEGSTAQVVTQYRTAMMSKTLESTPAPETEGRQALELKRNRFGSQEVTIDRVVLLGDAGVGGDSAEIKVGSALEIAFRATATRAWPEVVHAAISIQRAKDGIKCCDAITDLRMGGSESARVTLAWPNLELAPGEYVVEVGVYAPDWSYAYDLHMHAYRLHVIGSEQATGVFSPRAAWRVDKTAG